MPPTECAKYCPNVNIQEDELTTCTALVISEYGVDELEPDKQKNPGAHKPLGALNPYPSQKYPGEHMSQSWSLRNPVELPNVPGGHACGMLTPVGQ